MFTRWLRRSLLAALVSGVVTSPPSPALAFTGRPTGDGGAGSPRLAVDQAPSYDFGVASLGDRGSHAWTLRNTGRGDLEVWLEKEPSCGCTVTSLAKGRRHRIASGGSMEIKLEWKTRKTDDVFTQSATIGTNDPARPGLTLRISGRVYEPVVASPEALTFYPLYTGETHRADVAIFSPDRPDFALSEIVSSRPDLIAAALKPMSPDERDKRRAKAGYHLAVEIKPGMPMGVLSETLIVHTNHPERPALNIRIGGVVTGPITAAPSRLSIPVGGAAEGASRDVMLLVQDGRETRFDVLRKPGGVDVSIAPADAPAGKRRYRLTVTATARGQAAGGTDFITVKTDHPKVGVVKIPVSFTSAASGPISATPGQLSIPAGGAAEGASRDVMLLVQDGRETRFDVLRKPGGIDVSIAPAGKRRYRLTVTATARGQADRESDFIIVRTDHPRARLVTIPVSFAARRADAPTPAATADPTGAAR